MSHIRMNTKENVFGCHVRHVRWARAVLGLWMSCFTYLRVGPVGWILVSATVTMFISLSHTALGRAPWVHTPGVVTTVDQCEICAQDVLAEVVVVGVGWGQSVSGFRLLRLVEPLGFAAVLAGPTSGLDERVLSVGPWSDSGSGPGSLVKTMKFEPRLTTRLTVSMLGGYPAIPL